MLTVSKLTKLLKVQPDYDSLLDHSYITYKNDISRLRIIHLGVHFGKSLKNDYIYRFYELFNNITNFSNIYSEFVVLQLTDDINKVTDKKVIQTVIDLFNEYGDNIPEDLADAARNAAGKTIYNTAYSAAWNAANSAVYGASYSVVYSVTDSNNDNNNSEYLLEIMKRRI